MRKILHLFVTNLCLLSGVYLCIEGLALLYLFILVNHPFLLFSISPSLKLLHLLLVFSLIRRVIIDDGSGEGHLYADAEIVPVLLNCGLSEWNPLTSLAEKIGRVVYCRHTYTTTSRAGEVS